ncbi:MAG: hypothetical protein WD851_01835 [Pirellulales bacterium]
MGRLNYRPADPTERVREITWALVDDHIKDAEWSELQTLLTDSTKARLAYIEAMQLHTDLLYHFKDRQADGAGGKPRTTVLSFLSDSGTMNTPTFEVGS